MSESDILKLFPAMTLEDTSWKLKKDDTSGKMKEKKEKKLYGVNFKRSNKKRKEHGRWYFGVKTGKRLFAEIVYPDGRLVCLGTYKSPKLAAIAYDKVVFKIYGSQAMLKFPVMVTHNYDFK